MNSVNKGPHYVYQVPRDQIGAHITVSKGDHEIIRMYKDVFRRPMIAVLHAMVGQSAKCWEEKHEKVIENLQERVRIQAKIIVAYLNKYGPITKRDPNGTGKA